MTDSIESTVVSAIATTCQLDPEAVQPDMTIDDLGLGSMGLISVISSVEGSYACEFSPDQIVSLLETRTVSEFSTSVRALISAASVAAAR